MGHFQSLFLCLPGRVGFPFRFPFPKKGLLAPNAAVKPRRRGDLPPFTTMAFSVYRMGEAQNMIIYIYIIYIYILSYVNIHTYIERVRENIMIYHDLPIKKMEIFHSLAHL